MGYEINETSFIRLKKDDIVYIVSGEYKGKKGLIVEVSRMKFLDDDFDFFGGDVVGQKCKVSINIDGGVREVRLTDADVSLSKEEIKKRIFYANARLKLLKYKQGSK
jgi:ribosomal protein L24